MSLFFDSVDVPDDGLAFIPVEVNGEPRAVAIPKEWVDSVYVEVVSSGRRITRFHLEWDGDGK